MDNRGEYEEEREKLDRCHSYNKNLAPKQLEYLTRKYPITHENI